MPDAPRPVRLADLTTLRLGGPAGAFVEATTEQEVVDAVAKADEAGERLLLMAGGSNLVVSDDGFPGTVVRVATAGVQAEQDGDTATVAVAAGVTWDPFVTHAVRQRWVGVEALCGIPGSVGATPIQNVGAYGQEVSETIVSVRCWDRLGRSVKNVSAADCGFGYRTSRFKQNPQRFVVLEVTFRFPMGDLGAPVRYAELARTLGVGIGDRVPTADVRHAVLGLRRAKGMVLDAADHDTWSAGSFFTNPFLTPEQVHRLPPGAPRWEQSDGTTKTSAAWLIEQAGFARGYGNDRVALSTKHTLALTNRGAASSADLVELAEEIQRGVHEKFGVWLANEPVLVGCELPPA